MYCICVIWPPVSLLFLPQRFADGTPTLSWVCLFLRLCCDPQIASLAVLRWPLRNLAGSRFSLSPYQAKGSLAHRLLKAVLALVIWRVDLSAIMVQCELFEDGWLGSGNLSSVFSSPSHLNLKDTILNCINILLYYNMTLITGQQQTNRKSGRYFTAV